MIKPSTKVISILLLSSVLNSCSSLNLRGISAPTVMTIPTVYLRTIELNKTSIVEVVDKLGNPTNETETDGLLYLSYYLGKGYGERQYIYIFRNDLLVDVVYKDQGPYSGIKASDY